MHLLTVVIRSKVTQFHHQPFVVLLEARRMKYVQEASALRLTAGCRSYDIDISNCQRGAEVVEGRLEKGKSKRVNLV